MRVSSSYDLPNEAGKVTKGDVVNISAKTNDGDWVYAEVNNQKYVLPARVVE